MGKINENWVKEQFAQAKVRLGVGNAVLKLLAAWRDVSVRDNDVPEVVDIFSKLIRGHSLAKTEETNGIWVPVRRGDIKVADYVRVKADAFDGELGMTHNGREGVVTAIRSGDIIMKTNDDREPQLDGAHYSPEKLEKMVK
jgi:hypothetical protein